MIDARIFIFLANLLVCTVYSDAVVSDQDSCRYELKLDATTPGIISSPYYGEKPYPPLLYCKYTITAPEGYRIKLTFKDVNIRPSNECSQDKLTIYKADWTERVVYCGNYVPFPILSLEGENKIMFDFKSYLYANGKGYQIQYESSPNFKSVCEEGKNECHNRNCYSSEQKCDGVDDCGDGTDEEKCEKPIQTWPENCGVPVIKPNTIEEGADRMVGGDEVIPNSWPWQVSLQSTRIYPNNHFCGGTIINAQWVLTAAHCVSRWRHPGEFRLHIGAHSKFNKTRYEQIRLSAKVIAYPDLEGDDILKFNARHDMALVKLNAPVTFNAGVQPACLPNSDMEPEVGRRCYITGWGETRGSGGSDVLKQQDQIVKSPSECPSFETTICVGNDKKAACHGDSGGPLNCKVGDKWYVYGCTSVLIPTNIETGLCVGGPSMNLYSSTVLKADWIKETINKHS